MNNITTLLNTEENIPEVFYVFVNFGNFTTKHNLEITKGFTSAAFGQIFMTDFIEKYVNGNIDYLPFIPNPSKDLMVISLFNNDITSEYQTEYNCELYRRYNYPKYPSRLSAIYAFGDFETCLKVSEKYHWDIKTVRKFRLEPTPLNRVVKVNMDIISVSRLAARISMTDPDTQNKIWETYWTGYDNFQLELPTIKGRKLFNSEIIWEYLIEGRLTLIED